MTELTGRHKNAADFLPKIITVWREGYGLSDLKADLLAGLTVAIVALPLSMAIAIASGVGPERGLYTAIVGGFLVSALGGGNDQVEHAAEIAMEHNLGMTCDPIAGLVQIPCIERNAFGAIKAVNAARMAMQNTTGHRVTLDQVIKTMYDTGMDMQSRYKETSLGGLALNVIEC